MSWDVLNPGIHQPPGISKGKRSTIRGDPPKSETLCKTSAGGVAA